MVGQPQQAAAPNRAHERPAQSSDCQDDDVVQCVRPADHTGALSGALAQQEPAQPAEVSKGGVCVEEQDLCPASRGLPSAAQPGKAGAAVDDDIDVVAVEPTSRQQGCQDGQPQSEETHSDLPGLKLSDFDSGRTVTAAGMAAARPINQEQDSQRMQSSHPAKDTSLPGENTLKGAAPVVEGAGAAVSPQVGTEREAATGMAVHRQTNAVNGAVLQQQASEALHDAPRPDNIAPGRDESCFTFPPGQCSQTGSLADGGHAGDCRASPSKDGVHSQQPRTEAGLGRNNSDGLAADETGGIPTLTSEAAVKQARDVSKQASGHSDDSRCARCGLAV